MFRLSKTTDYGILLMAQLAADSSSARGQDTERGRDSAKQGASEPRTQNARELAETSDLPVPMVSKILKALAKEGLLVSQRGSKGGYSLARAPEDLTVSDMIRVLEGPVALTDCAIGPSLCEHETMCAVRAPWQVISRVVERALADVTLADLIGGPGSIKGPSGSKNLSSPVNRFSTSRSPFSTMLQIDTNSDRNESGTRDSS